MGDAGRPGEARAAYRALRARRRMRGRATRWHRSGRRMRPRAPRRDRLRAGLPGGGAGRRRAWVIALLATHAALALWGAAMNSVTFDEISIAGRRVHRRAADFTSRSPSRRLRDPVRPARSTPVAQLRPTRSCRAARMIAEAEVGRASCGSTRAASAALLRRAAWPCCSRSRSAGWCGASRAASDRAAPARAGNLPFAPGHRHAGIAGVDMAAGLAFTAAVYAFWRFARTTRWRVPGSGARHRAKLLTRFSALQLARSSCCWPCSQRWGACGPGAHEP